MGSSELTFILSGTNIHFTPLGGPTDDNLNEPFFSKLGYAFSSWARMEYMLTCLALHINKAAASPALYEPNPQTKFSELTKLLRRWITQHPDYAHVISPVDTDFFDALLEMAKFRNALTHGALQSIDAQSGEFVLQQTQRLGKNKWVIKTVSYKIKAINFLAELANSAHRHFVEIGRVIFEDASQPPSPNQKA